MKKKGYLTRLLIMCLIVIFSLAGNPGLYSLIGNTGGSVVLAATLAATPTPAASVTPGPSVTPGATTTPGPSVTPAVTATPVPQLGIYSGISTGATIITTGAIPTGSEFKLNYHVSDLGPASVPVSDVENVLFVVGSFTSGEQVKLKNQKQSRFTREVLKYMVKDIWDQKKNSATPCKVGFLKIGDSTVLEAFKPLDKDYVSDTVYSGVQGRNYQVTYNALTNSSYYNSATSTAIITKTEDVDKDVNGAPSSIPSGSYDIEKGYNDIKEQSISNPGTYTLKDNINVDIANLFTAGKNVSNSQFKNTMDNIKSDMQKGKTRVYFILDGYSADNYYTTLKSGAVTYDSTSNIGDVTMSSSKSDSVLSATDKAGIGYNYFKISSKITGTGINPDYNFESTFSAGLDGKYGIMFNTNAIDLHNVVQKCIYVNTDNTNIGRYRAKFDFDPNLKYKDSDTAAFNKVPVAPSDIENPMKFEEAYGTDGTDGVSLTDDTKVRLNNLVEQMPGSTSVKLLQDIPVGVKVTSDVVPWTWQKSNSTDPVKNDLTGVSAVGMQGVATVVYGAGTKLKDFDYSQNYTQDPSISLKCTKPGEYILKYNLVYTDVTGTTVIVPGEQKIIVKTDVVASFVDNSSITIKKGTQKSVGIKINTFGASVKNIKIYLQTQDGKVNINLQPHTPGLGDDYSYTIDGDNVAFDTTGVITLQKKSILQIKPIYTPNPATQKYEKDVWKIIKVECTPCDSSDPTNPVPLAQTNTTDIYGNSNINPAVYYITKPITVYDKIKLR